MGGTKIQEDTSCCPLWTCATRDHKIHYSPPSCPPNTLLRFITGSCYSPSVRSHRTQPKYPLYSLGFLYDPASSRVLVGSDGRRSQLAFFGRRISKRQSPSKCFLSEVRRHLRAPAGRGSVSLIQTLIKPELKLHFHFYVFFINQNLIRVNDASPKGTRYAWAPLSGSIVSAETMFNPARHPKHLDSLKQGSFQPALTPKFRRPHPDDRGDN
jgi:hypothetical protein